MRSPRVVYRTAVPPRSTYPSRPLWRVLLAVSAALTLWTSLAARPAVVARADDDPPACVAAETSDGTGQPSSAATAGLNDADMPTNVCPPSEPVVEGSVTVVPATPTPTVAPGRAAATPTPTVAPAASPSPTPTAATVALAQGSDPCAAPVSAAHAAADTDAIAKAGAAGVSLAVGRRCAGITVLVQAGVDATSATDLGDGLAAAYRRLTADLGMAPSRRTAMFVLADADMRFKTLQAIVTPASTAMGNVERIAPAFEEAGDIWVDASMHLSRAARVETAAHELTHVFVAVVAAGHPVPQWLNEGLAVYNQLTIPAGLVPPEQLDADTAARRRTLLDAVTGVSRPPFALSEIDDDQKWDANYPSDVNRNLQYAEAHAIVKWLVEQRGAPTIWRFFKDLGSVPYTSRVTYAVPRNATPDQVQAAREQAVRQRDTAEASHLADSFTRVFGTSQAGIDAAVRPVWTADSVKQPGTVHLTIHLAPSGVQPATWLSVRTRVNGAARGVLTRRGVPAGDYTFDLMPDGSATETSSKLKWSTDNSAPLTRDGFSILIGSAVYGGSAGLAAGGAEQVSYQLLYGVWSPYSNARAFFPSGATRPEFPPGALAEPYPDGNAILISLPK